jgi:ComF family protein
LLRRLLGAINRPCLLCDQSQSEPCGLCALCQKDLPWLARGCPRCAMPWPDHKGLYNCFNQPPRFNQCQAAFAYDFPIKQLILTFKDHGNLAAGHPLTLCLAQRIVRDATPSVIPDLLIPVPSSWRKRRQRGYNPAALIAKDLARVLNRPWTPKFLKTRPTQQDRKHQSRQQRLNDVTNPFYLTRARAPCHIAIIDDVVTSMATANHVAERLQQAGFHNISLWALARSLPPGANNRPDTIDD